MRHLFPGFLQLLPENLRRVGLYDDLCFEIGTGAIAKIFVILPCETIRAAVHAPAIAIYRIAPTAFPI